MRLLILFFLLCPFLSVAQKGSLTVTSESNTPFDLYLNDVKQNDKAGSKIRVEKISQTYVNLKIIIAESKQTISKKNISLVDMDNVFMNTNFKLRLEKNGKFKLQFYEMNYTDNENKDSSSMQFVYRDAETLPYEKIIFTTELVKTPVKKIVVVTEENKKEIPERKVAEIKENPKTVAASVKKCNGWPITKEDFDKAKMNVVNAKSVELKLKEAKSLTSSNCLMVSQVMELTSLLQTENTKTEFIRFAYAYTIDRQNYGKLKSVIKDAANQALVDELIKMR